MRRDTSNVVGREQFRKKILKFPENSAWKNKDMIIIAGLGSLTMFINEMKKYFYVLK